MVVRKFLFWVVLLLIPCRDWSFDLGISFYAVDVVLIFVAFDFLSSVYNRKFDVIGTTYLSLVIPASLPLILHVLTGDWILLFNGVIGIFKLLIYIIGFLWVKDLYSSYNIKKSTERFLFILFFFISIFSLVNFYTVSTFDIDFIGNFFDQISVRPKEVSENYLKLTFWTRNTSFAGEPNFLGIWAVLNYLVLIKTDIGKRNLGILLFICGLLVLSTFSRIAIAFLLFFIISFIVDFGIKNRCRLAFSIFVAFIIINVDFSSRTEITAIFASLENRDFKGDDGRLVIFQQAVNLFRENPVGYGISNYGRAAASFNNLFEPNPHNSFLIWLVEGGIIGLGWFIYFIFSILRTYYRVFSWRFTILIGLVMLVLFVNVFDKVFGFFLLLQLPLLSNSDEET